jgi:hypothetical protein
MEGDMNRDQTMADVVDLADEMLDSRKPCSREQAFKLIRERMTYTGEYGYGYIEGFMAGFMISGVISKMDYQQLCLEADIYSADMVM